MYLITYWWKFEKNKFSRKETCMIASVIDIEKKSASWGCTDLGIQFRRYQIRTCRKDTIEISKLSIFQKKITGEERIYGQKGFAVEQFPKARFSPLFLNHIFGNHVKSNTILICRNQIRSSHTPTVSISPIENIWFRGRDQDAVTTSNLRWLYVNLHIWMNPSSRGLPEYCNRCTLGILPR